MALFKLSHLKFATEAARHEPAVSSPRCLPLCKSQGELISHLAPCLLASQPHQALIHVEQEQRVLISPQRCLKTCLLGLALGGAKMLEMKAFTLRFIHLPPPPQHQPSSNRAAHSGRLCGPAATQRGAAATGAPLGKLPARPCLSLWFTTPGRHHSLSTYLGLSVPRGDEVAAYSF